MKNNILLDWVVWSLATLWLGSVAYADSGEGEKLYTKQCAFCHGKSGEGSKKYPKPLIGERSQAQLAEQIRLTMPQNDPGSLTKQQANQIAAYVYDGFYSLAARERNNPVRVELARLTIAQHKNALADIIGHFRGNNTNVDLTKRGLRGEYFKNRNFGQRLIDRIDPEVAFDFKTAAPAEKDFSPREFSARWTGSIYIPETGEYTFIVRSNQSVRLWVNNNKKPVADGYVRSGEGNEYRGSIFLLGGRVYPIRLEFSKALQGVQDKNPKPVPAFVSLLWQPPHGMTEVIPNRNLIQQGSPEVYVDETKFPPDDRSYGWERGTTISKAWVNATTESALDAANYVSLVWEELARTNAKDPKINDKAKTFVRHFANLAFRKPLMPDLEKLYIQKPFEGATDLQAGVKKAILLILKSQRFLFRELTTDNDHFEVASRMSFALWDSIPNEEMLKLAESGKLKTAEEIRQYVLTKMMNDTRSRAKIRGFLHHWLKTDHARDAQKDPKLFPGFDAVIIADLRTSLDLFLDDVVWSEKSDFKQLLLSEETYLNGRLAKYFGYDLPENAPFQKVNFEKGRRMGVITHPFLLSTFSYTHETSPIHRGVFVARGILGAGLKPPEEAFTPLAADLHPTLTTRERVELQTKGVNCQSCHAVINPLGFTLENFDAVGRYREIDNKKPINAEGNYQTRSGEVKSFKGAIELAKFLAESEDAYSSFVDQMFHHLIQQSIRAYGANTSQNLREAFTKNQFHIRQLAAEIVTTAALKGRK